MTPHDRAERLACAALDFDLTPTERAELDEHMSSCAACARFAAGLRSDIQTASAWPAVDTPSRVGSAVLASIDGPTWTDRQRPGRLSLALILVLLGLLALLALMIGGGRGPRGLLAVVQGSTVYSIDAESLRRSPLAALAPAPEGQAEWPVRWSLDGRRVFYADGGSTGADGADRIQAGYSGAVWSPDGSRYSAQLGFDEAPIGILDRSGAQVAPPIPLPPGLGHLVGRPVWSPDGRWLAIRGCSPDTCSGSDEPNAIDAFWIVAVDGSSVRKLTAPGSVDLSGARWSPDSGRIAYGSITSHAFTPGCRYPLTVGEDHICLDSARVFIARIADGSTTEIGDAAVLKGQPAWSKDGQHIALQVGEPSGTAGIATTRGDGSGLTRISSSGHVDALPVWSGDGQWIAYAASRSTMPASVSDFDVWIMRSDGTEARMVAAGAILFDWQPTR